MEVGSIIALLTGVIALLTAIVALLKALKVARNGESHLQTCIAIATEKQIDSDNRLRAVVEDDMKRVNLELKREVLAFINREMADIRKHLLKDQGE